VQSFLSTQSGCDLLKFPWIKPLLAYAYNTNETAESLRTDPDCRMIPSVLEKVLVPWINSKFVQFFLLTLTRLPLSISILLLP
jgi:hypothetical protein